jgi:hypothetical protein
MDLDTNRVRELLDQRDEIDKELQALITGTKERKPQKCGNCGEEGHTARSCDKPKT